MNNQENTLKQLQRYYTLWKDCTAVYEEWAKTQGLSSNGCYIHFIVMKNFAHRNLSAKNGVFQSKPLIPF